MTEQGSGYRESLDMPQDRFDQLAALVVSERVAQEYAANMTGATIDEKLFIEAVIPVLDEKIEDTEIVEAKRVKAINQINGDLKDRPLTAEEYKVAYATMRGLELPDNGFGETDLTQVLKFIDERVDDADARETQQHKAVESYRRPVSVVEVDYDSDAAIAERDRRAARRYHKREIRRLNGQLIVANLAIMASSAGFFGGIAGWIVTDNMQGKLPTYSTAQGRHTTEVALDKAQNDLQTASDSVSDRRRALGILTKADRRLIRAPQEVRGPLEAVIKDVKTAPSANPSSTDVFRADRESLSKEITAVRGLDTSPAAKKYALLNKIKDASQIAFFGSIVFGVSDEGERTNIKKKRAKHQRKLDKLF